ncbi:TnsD family Tn7-like transposition protein [Cupriavidus sp. UYPR2.512]|uniref:TnsD family Tn7-like transposition protein n=1 Tax=Cupriavidus sp. UYPR2.512 TaxID=1080187 RepID=UPI0003A2D59D|nr:TniQ family protein [Cupriavidus necator]
MQLCYVPQPLPDELLYSYLGRLSALNALGSPQAAMEALYGSRGVTPGVDLPTHLRDLVDRIGTQLPFSLPASELMSMSLYPYYRFFLPRERDQLACRTMLSRDARGLKTCLGLVANGFGAVVQLRFCRSCNRADLRNFGTSYWHREQQLPGVTQCIPHREALEAVKEHNRRGYKQKVILAPCITREDSSPASADTRTLVFATLSADLLRSSKYTEFSPKVIRSAYLHAICKQGITLRHEHVDLMELSRALLKLFDDFLIFPFATRVNSMSRSGLPWLRPLLFTPDRCCHPICHILLIQYLFGTLPAFEQACNEVLNENSIINEFPTVTRHIPSLREPTIDEFKDTSLLCSDIALRSGMSIQDVAARRRQLGIAVHCRRPRISPSVRATIEAMFERGNSASEIANEFRISLSSAYQIRSKLREVADNRKGPQRKKRPSRIDWALRDQLLSTRIYATYRTLCAAPRRGRVSRCFLLQGINNPMVEAHETELPKVHSLLFYLEESHLAFQLRRLATICRQRCCVVDATSLGRLQSAARIKVWSEYRFCQSRVYMNKA